MSEQTIEQLQEENSRLRATIERQEETIRGLKNTIERQAGDNACNLTRTIRLAAELTAARDHIADADKMIADLETQLASERQWALDAKRTETDNTERCDEVTAGVIRELKGTVKRQAGEIKLAVAMCDEPEGTDLKTALERAFRHYENLDDERDAELTALRAERDQLLRILPKLDPTDVTGNCMVSDCGICVWPFDHKPECPWRIASEQVKNA